MTKPCHPNFVTYSADENSAIAYESDTIRIERHFVDLPHTSRPLEYGVTVGKSQDLQPAIYLHGWLDMTEHLAQRATLVEAVADRGVGLMVALNDRLLPAVKDPKSRLHLPGGVYTHAVHAEAIIENQGLQHQPLPAWGFSAGGLAAARTVVDADKRGWSCFAKSPLILEVPAGLNPKESPLSLPTRVGGCALSDTLTDPRRDYSPEAVAILRETDERGVRAFMSNKRRASLEAVEFAAKKIPLQEVAKAVGHVTVISHGQDTLMAEEQLRSAVGAIFEDRRGPSNISYLTPYAVPSRILEAGQLYGRDQAHHLDSFVNPARVANVAGPILRQALIA